jgi:hypothetical protein
MEINHMRVNGTCQKASETARRKFHCQHVGLYERNCLDRRLWWGVVRQVDTFELELKKLVFCYL